VFILTTTRRDTLISEEIQKLKLLEAIQDQTASMSISLLKFQTPSLLKKLGQLCAQELPCMTLSDTGEPLKESQ